MEIDRVDIYAICFVVLAFCFLCFLIGIVVVQNNRIVLSQETADVICQKLTGNESAIAKDRWDFGDESPIESGELYCQIPSYDETHLIKVGT